MPAMALSHQVTVLGLRMAYHVRPTLRPLWSRLLPTATMCACDPHWHTVAGVGSLRWWRRIGAAWLRFLCMRRLCVLGQHCPPPWHSGPLSLSWAIPLMRTLTIVYHHSSLSMMTTRTEILISILVCTIEVTATSPLVHVLLSPLYAAQCDSSRAALVLVNPLINSCM